MTTAHQPRIPKFEMRHRLALALEAADVSVEEMADILGVHRNTVGNYLRGSTHPRKLVIQAWAMRCGVPVDWVLYGDPPAPTGPGSKCAPSDSNREPAGIGSVLRLVAAA